MALISVIVPVYKVEPYLHRCVDSILAQTFTDFELILVDDGSPDNCGAICDEYAEKDERILVIHQKNGGLSAARNAGIDWAFANSDSEWLTFIDSDDWVHRDYLTALFLAVMKSNTMISMCGLKQVTDIEIRNPAVSFSYEAVTPDIAYTYNYTTIAAYACGRLYHKKCFSNIRYPLGKAFEDSFTTHKILFNVDSVAFIKEDLYYYFQNPTGIVHSRWTPQKLDQITAVEELLVFFSGNIKMTKLISKNYLDCIHTNYVQIDYSNLNTKHQHVFKKELKKKMRQALLHYSKLNYITPQTSPHCFELAYPFFMSCYWLMLALYNKITKWK